MALLDFLTTDTLPDARAKLNANNADAQSQLNAKAATSSLGTMAYSSLASPALTGNVTVVGASGAPLYVEHTGAGAAGDSVIRAKSSGGSYSRDLYQGYLGASLVFQVTAGGNLGLAGTIGASNLALGGAFTTTGIFTLAGTSGSTLNIGAGGTLGTAAFTAATAYAPSVAISSPVFASTITPAVGTAGATIVYNIGTLTGPITIGAPTGTPTDSQLLVLRFVQDGTGGRVITWNAAIAFGTDITTADMPITASAKFEVGLRWCAADSKWRVSALSRGF